MRSNTPTVCAVVLAVIEDRMRNRILNTLAAASCLLSLEVNAAVPESVREEFRMGNFSVVEQSIADGVGMDALESDSLLAIMDRIRGDFNIPYMDGIRRIQQKFPYASVANIEEWVAKRYIECKTIDGKRYMFRKTVSNLDRLVPELSAARQAEYIMEDFDYMNYAKEAITSAGDNGLSGAYRVKVRFTATLKPGIVPDGKLVRFWGPFPVENERQGNIRLDSSSAKVRYSDGSIHSTVYMEEKASGEKPVVFEYEFSYDVRSQYFSRDFIERNMKPYDVESDLYKKYTSTEYPQIILTDSMRNLAWKIVGNATNPCERAALVYDWVDAYFPWAGAREYSTIPNLAQYVLDNGHGDCGQVSLLYITLLRSLGIPARWESGWMLHPGKVGMHDWAEVYYEGIGWVPVDMSFGKIIPSMDENLRNFYKTGIDRYRLASNKGVGGRLSPAKKYVRSETVDFQLGEMEYDGKNLFYYRDWTPKFELISIEKIKQDNCDEQ